LTSASSVKKVSKRDADAEIPGGVPSSTKDAPFFLNVIMELLIQSDFSNIFLNPRSISISEIRNKTYGISFNPVAHRHSFTISPFYFK
jgi:hypothetical protein